MSQSVRSFQSPSDFIQDMTLPVGLHYSTSGLTQSGLVRPGRGVQQYIESIWQRCRVPVAPIAPHTCPRDPTKHFFIYYVYRWPPHNRVVRQDEVNHDCAHRKNRLDTPFHYKGPSALSQAQKVLLTLSSMFSLPFKLKSRIIPIKLVRKKSDSVY